MTLTSSLIIDKIEVMEDGTIQVRQRTDVFDDSIPTNIIASSYHRWPLVPGQDLTGQDPKVVSIANATWTQSVITSYQSKIASQNNN